MNPSPLSQETSATSIQSTSASPSPSVRRKPQPAEIKRINNTAQSRKGSWYASSIQRSKVSPSPANTRRQISEPQRTLTQLSYEISYDPQKQQYSAQIPQSRKSFMIPHGYQPTQTSSQALTSILSSSNLQGGSTIISVQSGTKFGSSPTTNGSSAVVSRVQPLNPRNFDLNRNNREAIAKIKNVSRGAVLRGPTIIQMICNYIFFTVFLLVANQTNWAPYVRFYLGVLYLCICSIMIQITRVMHHVDENSIMPFYTSLVSFGVFIFISREAHLLGFLLWVVAFLIIYLQSGLPNLTKLMYTYGIAILCVYAITVTMMYLFYKTDCIFAICGQPLFPPMDYRNEIMIIIAFVQLLLTFASLDGFIKRNAVALLDRDTFLAQLYKMNIELRRQFRKERSLAVMDLESPLTKVVQILAEIRDGDAVDNFMVKELDRVMRVLNSGQLYSPDLNQHTVDADVGEWLKGMMQTAAKLEPSVAMRNGGQLPSLDRRKDGPPGNRVKFTISGNGEASLGFQEHDIFELLHSIEDPNFNVVSVNTISNGRVLFYVGYYLFEKHGFMQKFKIPEMVFRNWLTRIESGYRETNPYHNAIHAADVTHSMNYFITRDRIWPHLIPEEQLASIVAAIIHDFMHPGVNNNFLINSIDPLAIRYNDTAVLENFHSSTVFELMHANPELDIFKTLPIESQKLVREMVISQVLATDIALHFDWIGKFKSKMSPGGGGLNFEAKLDRKLMLNIAIKCADVNNPAKPLESCKYWTEKVMEEFFRQGDEELKRGKPISLFMNRNSTDIPKCQIGFIDFLVYPLYETWGSFMQEDVESHLNNIKSNKKYWKDQSSAM